MFYDPAQFTFTAALESHWKAIKRECENAPREKWSVWPEPELEAGDGWKVFGLFAFHQQLHDNCALCPNTARIVASIPGLTTAGFSILSPKTRIRPHVGYTSAVLRCHLGLIVPDRCGLRVGDHTRTWQPGKCLVFDDTVEHAAWNDSEQDRVVLLLDVLKPGATFTANVPSSVKELLRKTASE